MPGCKSLRVGLVIYFGIGSCLVGTVKALKEEVAEVFTFPLMKEQNTYPPAVVINHMKDWIFSNGIQVIIWWYLHMPTSILRGVRNAFPLVPIVAYNFDDPTCWLNPGHGMKAKAALLDAAACTCSGSIPKYKQHGCPVAVTLMPGHDPEHFGKFASQRTAWDMDVSFVATNLYTNKKEFPRQLHDRTALIGIMAKHFRFGLYGPKERVRKAAPGHYRGRLHYFDLAKIFNASAVNLCTHGVATEKGCLNERCILVLASRGLLYVDQIRGSEAFLQDGVNCVVMQRGRIVQQVREILANPAKYNKVREAGYRTALKFFTWARWAKVMASLMPAALRRRKRAALRI